MSDKLPKKFETNIEIFHCPCCTTRRPYPSEERSSVLVHSVHAQTNVLQRISKRLIYRPDHLFLAIARQNELRPLVYQDEQATASIP